MVVVLEEEPDPGVLAVDALAWMLLEVPSRIKE